MELLVLMLLYNNLKITNLLNNPIPILKELINGIGGGLTNTIGKFIVGYSPYVFYVYKQVYG